MSVSEIKQLERDLGAVIGYLSAPKLSAVQLVIRKAEAIKRLTRMLDEAKFLKQQTKCMVLHELFAEFEGRSINGEVLYLIRQAIAQHEKNHGTLNK